MNQTSQRSMLARWWFACALLALLVAVALVSTPSGQALAGKAQVAAQYVYYAYLSLIFTT